MSWSLTPRCWPSPTGWCIRVCGARTSPTLLGGYCERLVAAGVPIWRGYLSALTLHPRVRGVGCSWRPGQGAQSELYIYRAQPSEDYLVSPFAYMFERGLPSLRVPLAGDGPIEFPLLARFRDEGATDYLAHVQSFGLDGEPDGETGMVASWTTDRPGGFSNRDLALLTQLLPRLALAVQARLGHEIAVNLLDTYVGPEAGRRILAGKIRRGQLEVIAAVILYADLRGFTAATDQNPRDEMVETLNCYFDRLVPDHRGVRRPGPEVHGRRPARHLSAERPPRRRGVRAGAVPRPPRRSSAPASCATSAPRPTRWSSTSTSPCTSATCSTATSAAPTGSTSR